MGLRKGETCDAVAIKGAGGPPALIDGKSQVEYKKEFEKHRLHATEAESLHLVNEYIKKKIDDQVDKASAKRKMDVLTTVSSVGASTVLPLGGIPVVVAATLMECFNFSAALGLIPVLNVTTMNELEAMTSQLGTSISRAAKDSIIAGIEAAVLEILKKLGLGDWLWTEILKDILTELAANVAFDSSWVMTPIFAAAKYKLHRRLIKQMNRKLGDKAQVVHYSWTQHHCLITA